MKENKIVPCGTFEGDYEEALIAAAEKVDIAKLDLLLLDLERQQGMMDGLKMEEWIL